MVRVRVSGSTFRGIRCMKTLEKHGQLWAWPVKVLCGSSASCSDIIFLEPRHFTQSPAAPWNLGCQFSWRNASLCKGNSREAETGSMLHRRLLWGPKAGLWKGHDLTWVPLWCFTRTGVSGTFRDPSISLFLSLSSQPPQIFCTLMRYFHGFLYLPHPVSSQSMASFSNPMSPTSPRLRGQQ